MSSLENVFIGQRLVRRSTDFISFCRMARISAVFAQKAPIWHISGAHKLDSGWRWGKVTIFAAICSTRRYITPMYVRSCEKSVSILRPVLKTHRFHNKFRVRFVAKTEILTFACF